MKAKHVQDGFAIRLRQLRRKQNLTQGELGNRVGMTSDHIGRYERGTATCPSAQSIQRLAEALGVSSEYLLKGTEEPASTVRALHDQGLIQRLQEIEQLPEDDQVVVKKLLDAFIANRKIHELTSLSS